MKKHGWSFFNVNFCECKLKRDDLTCIHLNLKGKRNSEYFHSNNTANIENNKVRN